LICSRLKLPSSIDAALDVVNQFSVPIVGAFSGDKNKEVLILLINYQL
jgi:hypothetical protein